MADEDYKRKLTAILSAETIKKWICIKQTTYTHYSQSKHQAGAEITQ